MSALNEARKKINEIDTEMARLFEMRMSAVKKIAEYKMSAGLPIFDKEREEEIIRDRSKLIEDDELRAFYVSFMRDGMSVSRRYQEKLLSGMKVAFSGTVGAFAHIAATKLFPTAEKMAYSDFAAAYAAVESGKCDVAVLPLENSYNGEVGQVTDLMFSGSLYVNEVTDIAITQDLVGVKGATVADIKKVISHPQALGQCASFIKENGFITEEYSNTALAAKAVAELDDKTLGAIASAEAAEIFGLDVIARNINASRTNTTRFAVFSRAENTQSASVKGVHSIMLFTVRNEAGALAKAIDIIGKHGFNMQMLRSRPMKELLWQYYFYVEAEGNLNTEEGKKMLSELAEYCDKLKSVGSYVKK